MITFTADKLKQARDAGYSDDEIWGFASQQDERFSRAREAGYSLDEVSGFFSEQQPQKPEESVTPVGTSIGAELAAIPQALKQAVGQPLEAMGETATVLGMPRVGAALRGAIEEPEGYVPAAQRFMQPQEGEFQIGGFAPQFLPRAIVEQAGQVAGAIATSAAGRAIGGLVGLPLGPAGKVAGQVAGKFLGPALFEMSQIIGPVARERAANQGREEPNTDDLAWAWGTAGASGALNAIGAKYLPQGDKLVGGLSKRIATAIAGEGTTEGLQSVVQQTGQTFLTEQGLEIKPKEAIGEALIGGGAGGAAVVAAAPFTPTPEAKASAAADTKVAAEQAAPVAPETAQVVSEQANQVIAQAQAEETAETPDERVARLQREAQEAAGIELEEEVAGLPPVEPTPSVTPTPEAAVAPVEPVVPTEGAVEPAATEVAPEGTRETQDLQSAQERVRRAQEALARVQDLPTEDPAVEAAFNESNQARAALRTAEVAARNPNSQNISQPEELRAFFEPLQQLAPLRPAEEPLTEGKKWRRGDQVGSNESVGTITQAIPPEGESNIVYRGVTKEDYERILASGQIDSDMRGAVTTSEGINLSPDTTAARDYLPRGEAGVVIAIDATGLDLNFIEADQYLRSFNSIPADRIVGRSDFIFRDAETGDYLLRPQDNAPVANEPESIVNYTKAAPEAAPAAVEPTPVTPPVTPQLEPLRRVARAEQTEEDVAGLVDSGFVEVYNGQPVITQAGLEALPEAERPRLTPEARKIQIDTRTSEAAAEAISKNLRIGVDQVPADVRMPEGWTLVGDVYVPPQPQEVGQEFTVYRGELPALEGGRQLAGIRDVGELMGVPDSATLAPFTYYSTSEQDARAYLERDAQILRDYQQRFGNEEGLKMFQSLHGFDPRTEGQMVSKKIRPRKVFDMTEMGTVADQFKMTELIAKERGVTLPENWTWRDVPAEVQKEISDYGLDIVGDPDKKDPTWQYFRNTTERTRAALIARGLSQRTKEDVRGSLFAQWLRKNGYDAVAMMHETDQGPVKHLLVINEEAAKAQEGLAQPQAPSPTPEVREARREPAITTQQDRDYLDAVERGDLDAASRMAENTAKSRPDFAAEVYHGVGLGRLEKNRFDVSKRGTGAGGIDTDLAFFFSKKKGTADIYAGIQPREGVAEQADQVDSILTDGFFTLLNATPVGSSRQLDNFAALYEGGADPFAFDERFRTWSRWIDDAPQDLIDTAREVLSSPAGQDPNVKNAAEYAIAKANEVRQIGLDKPLTLKTYLFGRMKKITAGGAYDPDFFYSQIEKAWNEGYDILEIANVDDGAGFSDTIYAVRNPEQIKSADPVTYDDAGNIIPPSQRFQPEQADIRYSYAGVRAQTPQFMRDSLSVAQAMAAKGEDAEAIRSVTGWIVNPYDGKLRWEIPDNDAKFINLDDSKFWVRDPDGSINSASGKKLSEILDHPNLFAAYPEIADQTVDILIVPRGGDASIGAYFANPYSGKANFEATGANQNRALSALLHEIQHWIQDKEGFSTGTNPQAFLSAPEIYKKWLGRRELMDLSKELGISPVEAAEQYRGLDEYEDRKADARLGQQDPDMLTDETINRNLKYWRNRGKTDMYTAYERTAGEIESRDVQARMKMTPEQRKATAPYSSENISPEDAVIMGGEGGVAALRGRRIQMARAGMETGAVEARLQELGFPAGGIIRVVNQPDADFEGRTIILDGKVTGIELNAAAMADNATIDRVLNHEFAESANADGALNKLVERLTPKEKKEINDTITRLRYEERARTSEEAARAIETLAEAWKGRGFFTRAVARIEAWASKLGFKLTRRAAEYIAARNLADINSGFRAAYNRFINVRGEAREGRAFVTPEENARFMELAKDPEANREELQQMVDEAARLAGSVEVYHGGIMDWTVAQTGVGDAVFFTEQKELAQRAADLRGNFGLRVGENRGVRKFFISKENILDATADDAAYQLALRNDPQYAKKMDEVPLPKMFTSPDWRYIEDRIGLPSIKEAGFDGVKMLEWKEGLYGKATGNPSTTYAIFYPNQIKSADPVTYDDQGNVIPLEQRFQPTSEDIRYARRDYQADADSYKINDLSKIRKLLNISNIEDGIVKFLSRDLLDAKWAKIPVANDATTHGHCWVAAEAAYHILGGKGKDWEHRTLNNKGWPEGLDAGETHHFIQNKKTGEIIDPTRSQFGNVTIPYENSIFGGAFMGKTAESPSIRAKALLHRIAVGETRTEVRESRREPEAIPTFTEGTPEAATLKEMEESMAKVDAASEAKGGKPETYKISEIASVWMDSGLGERELQDAITEYTNLTPANAARVAKAIAKQYGIQQQLVEAAAPLAEIAPEPEGAPRKSAVTKLIEQTTGVRKPVVKLQVSESAALKKQIQLKAREARETRKARKEAAEELAKAITDYVKANPIRGPINSRQAMSITKKALKLDVNNEAAVDRFEMYVERVIENANYDRDLADARALIKRAKTFAKAKGTQGNVKDTLEAIANVAPALLNNPFEFNLVVQRYLLGLAPVTAKQYAVMPDADVRRYLESLETQIKDNQEILDRAKAQRILDKQAAYANEKGIPLDEAISILNSEEFLQEKTIEKLEDLTKLLTAMAQESQKDVKAYDDAGATPKQKELISFMRKVNLDSLINEEKKRYIRFANNLLANGATFGMEQFQSIALGQEAAMKAAKDRRLSNKLSAWISPIGGDKAIDTARRIAAKTQSEADTFKNIFGREAVGVFRNILGLNRLDVAQTDSNRAKEQIANEFGEYFKGLRKKYGDDATGFEAKGYAGIAGYLIQTDGNKTEAESIPYRRRLMEQNIVELRKSDKQSDLAEADLKERALAQLTGATNAEILSQLKALNPASYEQLMWVKDVMLPKWRDFLKEHDENFRNQANNYNNPDHLTITYKFPEGQLLPSEMEDVYQQDMIGMRIKQAANSIKRKDHPNLPVSKTGTIANIDINFGYNQYNALVDQVDKAFVAPAWEQVVAFTKAPEFEQVMGGRANALFVKNLLRDIQTSRSRQSITDDEAQLIAGGVRLARKISTQAVLGGITQPLRQVPDQLAKLFFTTGRFDLIIKNLLSTAQAAPLLNKFPIGRRGDAQAGTQYASQFSELARKVEASVTDRKWAKYRELMNKVGEFWMTPLRGSDVWAAKVSWMSYYEAELNKKGIKMESWEREAELVDTDQDRKEAASYAEFAVDFYGGASDPTKMASLSKQTNNGWKEFAKLVFLPLNSFALQQKNSLISDLRDAYLRTGDRKASIAAIAGTLAGMAAFHGMRIYIIGGLIYPAGKALLMGIFGIDMDEPDEEEKQKQLEDNWRKFKASMYGNIIAGGAGEFAEKAAIDAVNRTAYLWDANINPDSLLNDKGEIMSFRQYEKEVSPLYRFRSYGSSEYSFGLADVLTEQATHALAETQQLMTPEEMEKYTGNEQAYAAFATAVEWMYFFRLMDTDVKRIATDLKRQMDKEVKEREAELKRIREGR